VEPAVCAAALAGPRSAARIRIGAVFRRNVRESCFVRSFIDFLHREFGDAALTRAPFVSMRGV
jgi:hypothetical protein